MAIENVGSTASVKTEVTQAVSMSGESTVSVPKAISRPAEVTVSAGGQNNGEEGEVAYRMAKSTIKDTVAQTNHLLGQSRCEFSYHEATHRVSIKIIDKDTNEVVKEILPEKSLEMLQKMWEMAGILVDEKR